jgi:PPOX class probable F420-dependent enzyme
MPTPDRPTDSPYREAESDPAAAKNATADRRMFLRQLSGDAVVTAGKLAGASAVLRRSLVAAGEAAVGHLETATDAAAPGEPAVAPGQIEAPGAADTAASPRVASAPTPPDPVSTLTAAQHAFLANGTRAVLAVNDPGGQPLVSFTTYHWDGALIRVPGRASTARAVNIDRDPRVSLLIDDVTSDAWVAIAGVASLVYGDQVEPDARLILAKYHDEAEGERRWQEMRSSGDLLSIRVRPTRFVWRAG